MKKLTNLLTFIVLLLILPGCGEKKTQTAATDEPYLWLEEVESEKALNWVRAQNTISDEAFTGQPVYADLKERFLGVVNDRDRIIMPSVSGKHVYNLWQDATYERGLWRRMTLDEFIKGKTEWQTVLDLDKLSAEENRKWVFKGASWLAPDYSRCLLSVSDGGKDEGVIREFDAVKGAFVEGGFSVNESKGSAAWVDTDHIVVATSYGSETMTTSGYPAMVKLWKRGADAAEAETLLEIDRSRMGIFVGGVYSGGMQYTFINSRIGFYENEMYLYTAEGLKKIEVPSDVSFQGMFGDDLLLYLQSDWDVDGTVFTSGSLVSFNMTAFLSGSRVVRPIYKPDERSSFASLLTTKEFIVVSTLDNVQSRLKLFSFNGQEWTGEAVPVPEFGTVALVSSDDESNDFFFSFSNPVTPSTLYYGNGSKITVLKQQKAYFEASGLVVNQYEALSKDGTKVPYFIVHRSAMDYNGANPTFIYAYGGFNSSTRPTYSAVTGIGWLEKGGVYVIANIRGGGEFGPAWHQAALREKRQNAYDDFHAVAEDLIKRKITSPEHIGINGGSNGGLLVGVAFTQRPDLYKAVVVDVPLLDMRRYSKLLAGASWMDEYGDPDKPEDWAFISKYSPYHNLSKKKTYPEVLFVTSTKDDRVHPAHARKMAAKMLDMGHPIYYHETIEGGHGAASTNAQRAEKWAMTYTYLSNKLMSSN
ncbi:MAG: S9 family peptidase [Bacteroidales bacterium]|nr:S9 family peptidase [Bacteroidales bacterium]